MNNIIDKILSEPLLIIFCLIFIALIVLLVVLIITYLKSKKEISDNFKALNESAPELTEEQISAKEELSKLLTKMEDDLKKQEETKKDEIITFEEEQEEKAIISYQELLAATKKNKEETSEPIETLSFEEPIVPDKKFKNTDIISPVYGIINKDIKYPTINNKLEIVNSNELEKTLNLEPLSNEIKKNDEFLRALKEFRKNL